MYLKLVNCTKTLYNDTRASVLENPVFLKYVDFYHLSTLVIAKGFRLNWIYTSFLELSRNIL